LSGEAETLLTDFDFLLGRFLEARYASVVPAEIPVINQLLEQVIMPARSKTPAKPVAIILLDGMRYDLWQEIVRPHLERRYQLDEQVGMSLLPSETRISRFGFFSGLKPAAYFEKPYAGGEWAACEALLKRVSPGHDKLVEWKEVAELSSFAFCTADKKLFGAVFDFADTIGHAGAWEMGFLAELVHVWLKRFDQAMSRLPPDCVIWITTDHGQVISGATAIDIPADWLVGASNGYRAALIKDRLQGFHANHVFYLKARDLGYDEDGYWAFPKPGYSFRLQDKDTGTRSRFKPIANMRHSGLSAFEIFIPIARLATRVEQVRVVLAPKGIGRFTVGMQGQIAVEISANSRIQGHVELVGNADGVQPALVQNLDSTPQTVHIPFNPTRAGSFKIVVEARWGFKALPDPVTVTVQVDAGPARPTDGLDEKLKKFFA
jgi:hypothetical protein